MKKIKNETVYSGYFELVKNGSCIGEFVFRFYSKNNEVFIESIRIFNKINLTIKPTVIFCFI
jgi:hypothetical protein